MHDFVWAQLFWAGVNHHNVHIIHSALVLAVLSVLAVLVHRKLKHTESRLIPDARGTLSNIMEVAVEQILGLMEGVIGPSAHKYFPLFGALFLYILTCNLLSVIPGFLPPTDNINTNLACSLTVFVYYNYVGIKEHGLGYLKHFMGPIIWLGPLMLVIELIGHLVRPVSLSLRLFGNITGDHLVLGIFSDLVPVLIPVAFLALGVFVAFIQAFVFTLLSMIYVGLAVEHEHEEAHS